MVTPLKATHPSSPTDADRKAHDGAANERLRTMVDAHFDFVWRSVRRLGVPSADADDVTQKVFWLAARRLDRIQDGAERGYLFAVAARLASDFRRAHQRDAGREVSDSDLIDLSSDGKADVEALLDQKRARAMLDLVLDGLPTDLRTVIVLAEGEQMTMAEISEILGVPPGTVASRLRRARAAFDARVERLAERRYHLEDP